MNNKTTKRLMGLLGASMLLAAGTLQASTVVNLTAQRSHATLPDGTSVPMWQFCGGLAAPSTVSSGTTTGGACGGAWKPGPTIIVPSSDSLLTINLVNNLKVPTSIVILGQIGGGLGTPQDMTFPAHNPQPQTTFPAAGGATFSPPPQPSRVQSFSKDAEAPAAGSVQISWDKLKPGTYIYEAGTLPSLQVPMGLYGLLIVTEVPSADAPFAPRMAYPADSSTSAAEVKYDSDAALLFSEIDPVQNAAVDAAEQASADYKKRFDDPGCSSSHCYPAAVNYTPTYFLINGQAYDQTAPQLSSLAAGSQYSNGKILLRLANAGLRTHIPSVVGLPFELVAEDGNLAPGNPKVQSEALLTAGKTYDVIVHPSTDSITAPTAYKPQTYGVFDRQGSLTNANASGGGMQAFLLVNGANANKGDPGREPAAADIRAVADTYAVPLNTQITFDVRTNDVGVKTASVGTDPTPLGSVASNADKTLFTYTPSPGFNGTDSFSYIANGDINVHATVTLTVGSAAPPVAVLDTYYAPVGTVFKTSGPGVLANDKDDGKYQLVVDTGTVAIMNNSCGSVDVAVDGGFTATGTAGSACTFTYKVRNSQGRQSVDAAPVTVNFPRGSGLKLAVLDATTGAPITDYSWTIQEDLTFKHDTNGTPSLSTRTLGTSFHTSHMPVFATGCVGDNSCGTGQTVRGRAAASLLRPSSSIADVKLDPTKNYYISILPGDAADPVVNGGNGHIMGGAEVSKLLVAHLPTAGADSDLTIRLQPSPLTPAQLSIFVYEDNSPTNGQNDLNEQGLGGFAIILMDPAGRTGDPAGQQTYDAANMPLSNALLGAPGCPDDQNLKTNGAATSGATHLVGVVYTCPNVPQGYTGDPADYALAGHALIKNLTPARYDVIAHPSADREAAGQMWLQTETLEGTPAQDAFTGINEPSYFQEFGPPGFHTTIGFVNSKGFAPLTGTGSITGRVTNQHMSRPSDVTLWDSGSYDLLSSTFCQVALNSQGGTGPTIAVTACDPKGGFKLDKVPPGAYELAIWDYWLDQIIQTEAVTVAPGQNVTVGNNNGNVPVLSWFTQYDQNIFLDANRNGIYDANETGISNVPLTVRYRNGSISNTTLTDSSGNGILTELFPLFNWYVAEADTTRFKQTGVDIVVDGGGPVDTDGDGAGLYSSKYATGETSHRLAEIPGSYSYGIQSFISQRNVVNWGRAPYDQNENGGIQGVVIYSSTRPFDDQRYNVQTIWEPLVPRVTVNLYRKVRNSDGTNTLTLVDHTLTSSWDDWVNAVDANGKQINMQCPGQRSDDPFALYTLAPQNPLGNPDLGRCYDGFHNWNQVQAAPYDGRYAFPSPNCRSDVCVANPKMLPPGEYVVEAVTPPGYEIVKEEDKNIFTGDSFNAAVEPQFGPLGSIFILPDQATLNNANPYNGCSQLEPGTGKCIGTVSNATSNLGVLESMISAPECVGALHRVPDYLSLFPQIGLVAPFAGMDRPLCDRKLVKLTDQMQASASFFIFTQTDVAAAGTGIILDDASSEFNAASPDFGEKASVPFVPVSVKDFAGNEISRTYSDQWGAYNLMLPSAWLVNPPTPSGYGPNMLVTCMNDPGPIKDPVSGKMVTDPAYNPVYSNFCYTNPFMPGQTTYLDTPVLPIAAFASGYNPADCAYPDATPGILRVDSSAGFGPYLPKTGGTLTIQAIGFAGVNDIGVQVPNPAYAGPFATTGPTSKTTVTRHYGFGAQGPGSKVMLGGQSLGITGWTPDSITVTVPPNTQTGQLVVTSDNGKSSNDAVTVTLETASPKRVDGTRGDTIQAAIDNAAAGDLILINAGTYSELVTLWKPVRLQGVGAASVIINAAKYPTSKLESWRPNINNLFSIDAVTGNQTGTSQVDPLPTQEITGGVVLLEPSVLGAEEGAGITVLAKNLPATECKVGGNATRSNYQDPTSPTRPHFIAESNFYCGASRVDGISVTGGDAGGGIYVNGWAHNLEISNNRIYGNAGAYHGGVRIGVPYLEQELYPGQVENADGNAVGNPTVRDNELVGLGYDKNIRIHNNAITKNGTVEAPAGAGGAGGGVSICTGTDGYSVDHNWICGNYGASDGGGIGHLGFSQGGRIANNSILFNQTFQQTTSTHGGGIMVAGEPAVAGTLSLGTGNVTIDSNVIRGNFAEAGHGGGIRLQQVNGAEVQAFRGTGDGHPDPRWFKATITNNMIVNNVAGYGGGGLSMADTIASNVNNNTIASNDSVGIAGSLLAGTGETASSTGAGRPNPAGLSVDPTSAQLLAVVPSNFRFASVISNPVLTNDIFWKNRSLYYKVDNGAASLCSSNGDPAGLAACNKLLDQVTTGECTKTGSGDPAYWDLGVLGDASAGTPGGTTPLTAFNVVGRARGNGGGNNRPVTITVNAPLNAPNGALPGVTIAGVTGGGQAGNFNGTFTINVTGSTTFTYTPSGQGASNSQFNSLTFSNATVTLPAMPGARPNPSHSVITSIVPYSGSASANSSGDPQLTDLYCNGARATPEYPSVTNPPNINNLQVAATVDEGNNYVSLRYGPLYVTKPDPATTDKVVPFGDYHLQNQATSATSTAVDHGITIAGLTTDIDGDARPMGPAYDIGADELRVPVPIVTLSAASLAFGNQAVNTTSTAQSVTVTNTGTANLLFTNISALSGQNANQFQTGGGSCAVNVPVLPGASCTISVAFRPSSRGSKSATLTLSDNAVPGTQTISLSGTGAQGVVLFTSATFSAGAPLQGLFDLLPGVLPAVLNFGNLSGGQFSTVTLTNTGNLPVKYTSATVTGSQLFGKGADSCSGQTVPPNGTCTIRVNFAAPNGNSLTNGTLTIVDDATGGQQRLSLTGR
ncbi:MAG: multicopper oxidase type 3 [Gammaproteobacteria bacterium]|nr:multicopper oxidase type 3 [Gammaproteobacteria bacterium]